MDNIEHIHIAKVPYSIEPKAKVELKKYLADVRSRLDTDTADDVLHDIESRIPELLAQHHTKQGDVITHADIQFIKKQLGEPEQFVTGDDQAFESEAHPKKLFRDNDNAMLAGVASGVGKYFSIDANIVRVAFFAVSFFYGFGIILYLFLWLLLPEAKTNAEKLMMAGKPVTVSTLQRYQTTVNKSLGSGPRILQMIFRKFFRFISATFTVIASLYLLCAFAALSALFYVHPFREIVSGYGLDYLFLGLVWLGCLSFIGLLVLITAKIWGNKSSRLNITAIGLTVLLIVTIAGECASGLLIYNHFSDQYGGDKSIHALAIRGNLKAPKTLVVNSDSNLDLVYNVSDQPLHATYTAYPAMNRPNIAINENRGVITVNTTQLSKAAPECLGDLCQHIYLPVHVQLYGPSLQEYDNYDGAQLTVNGGNLNSSVTLDANNNSVTNVNNGEAGGMIIKATADSIVTINNTTAQNATITVDGTSNVQSPITTNILSVTMPDDCNMSSATTLLSIPQFPARTIINGQTQTLGELQQNGCISTDF